MKVKTMKTKISRIGLLLPSIAIAIFTATGCNSASRDSTSTVANPSNQAGNTKSVGTSDSDSDHGHQAGAHGGIMVSLGSDSYHIEAVIDSEGLVRLYTLGKDETRVIDIERQTLKGFAKADGDIDSKSIDFEPQPQEGDGESKTSLFVGKLPKELVGQSLDITVPNIRIAGERCRLGFQTAPQSHGDPTEMPDKIAEGEEQELYLTPNGRYTSADIDANGKLTASQKFKGIKSAHDMNPKDGDRICPITETKANPNFTWVIDGKSYEFCCPPCVDEFVKMAKSSADPLPNPDSFTKK
jgi:hypothetical protein